MKDFRERIYQGSSADAALLNTLLESEGVETDVVRGFRGTYDMIFAVNEAQFERAQEIVRHFLDGKPLVDPKSHKSWRCRGCNELVEGQFDVCWNCGASKT